MRRNLLYNNKLKDRARELRKQQTPAEKKLWYQHLKISKYRFLRQKPIGNYIADFYCPVLKLVIEIDGDTHYTEEAIKYDDERTAYLEGLGITVLRVTNDDVYNNFNEVCLLIDAIKPPLPKGEEAAAKGGFSS